jgi:hypothetical protein
VHAFRGRGQKRHVGIRARTGDIVIATSVPANTRLIRAMRSWREIGLGSDDGLDSRIGSRVPEVVGAEHVAMVGNRDGWHLGGDRGINQWLDSSGSIEH